jgi:hypothetical protein
MIKFNCHFDLTRFYHYLKVLKTIHLKKISFAFFSTTLSVYVVYIFLVWFFGLEKIFFTTIFYALHLIYLVLVSTHSVKCFENMHTPICSMSEYTLPVSTEERFLGNFIFHYLTFIFVILIMDGIGFIVFKITVPKESLISFITNIINSNGSNFIYYYTILFVIFFSTSIFFSRSGFFKTLLILVFLFIIKSIIIMTLSKSFNYFSNNLDNYFDFNYSITENKFYPVLINHIINVLLIITIWVLAFIKLKRLQYK